MEEILNNVNWLAVIVGAVLSFGLGALWYSPKLFGNKWMAGVGLTPDGTGPMKEAMIAQAAGTFLLAWVIGVTETTNSLMTALLIAVTIAVIIKANGLFVGKSWTAVMIESGFIIAMVLVMIFTHAVL